MKRLRDTEATTPLQRKAQELIGSVDPVSSSPERMARIRRRLDEPRGVMVAIRRLPALAIAALIGLFGASAFAAVRVFVEARAVEEQAIEQAPAKSISRRAVEPQIALPEAQPPEAQPPEAQQPEAQEGVAEPVDVGKSPRTRKPAQRVRAKPQPKALAAASEAAHDSELVHRAVKALRRDDNPRLAARLLDEDRVQNPSGPLAEEALSLRIEAAMQLDDPRARALAQQYITRYPQGRYLSIARRALEEPSQ